MKEENKKFFKDTFHINVDDFNEENLEKVLELIEAETIKNLYKEEAENKILKQNLNALLNKMTYNK